MDSRLRCRSFRSYTGQQKPRCNRGNPCEACRLLHFLAWLNRDQEPSPEVLRDLVEAYIRSNPR